VAWNVYHTRFLKYDNAEHKMPRRYLPGDFIPFLFANSVCTNRNTSINTFQNINPPDHPSDRIISLFPSNGSYWDSCETCQDHICPIPYGCYNKA